MMGRPSQCLQQPLVEHRYLSRDTTEFLEPGRRALPDIGDEAAHLAAPEGDPHDRTDRHLLAGAYGVCETAVDRERWDIGNNPGDTWDDQIPAAAASFAATSSASHENCGRPK